MEYSAEEKLAMALSKIEELADEIQQHRGGNRELAIIGRNLQLENQKLVDDLQQSQMSGEELMEEAHKLSSQLSLARKENLWLCESHQSADEKLLMVDKLQKELLAAKEMLSAKTYQLAQTEAQIQSLQQALKEKTEELQLLKQSTKKQNHKEDDIIDEVVGTDIHKLQQRLKKTQQSELEADEKVMVLEEEMDERNQLISSLQGEIGEMTSQVVSAREESQLWQAAFNEAREQLKWANETNEELQGEIQLMRATSSRGKPEWPEEETISLIMTESNNMITEDKEGGIEVLQEENVQLKEELSSHYHNYKELLLKLEQIEHFLKREEATSDRLAEEVHSMHEKIIALKNENYELEGEVTQAHLTIDHLEGSRLKLGEKAERLSHQLTNITNTYTDLTDRLGLTEISQSQTDPFRIQLYTLLVSTEHTAKQVSNMYQAPSSVNGSQVDTERTTCNDLIDLSIS